MARSIKTDKRARGVWAGMVTRATRPEGDGWRRGWEVSNDTPEKAEKIAALQDGIEKLFHASAALTEAIQKAHK